MISAFKGDRDPAASYNYPKYEMGTTYTVERYKKPGLDHQCGTWTDCDGDENGGCFAYPDGNPPPEMAEAKDCGAEYGPWRDLDLLPKVETESTGSDKKNDWSISIANIEISGDDDKIHFLMEEAMNFAVAATSLVGAAFSLI